MFHPDYTSISECVPRASIRSSQKRALAYPPARPQQYAGPAPSSLALDVTEAVGSRESTNSHPGRVSDSLRSALGSSSRLQPYAAMRLILEACKHSAL